MRPGVFDVSASRVRLAERVDQRRLADVRAADHRHLGGRVGQRVEPVGREHEAELERAGHGPKSPTPGPGGYDSGHDHGQPRPPVRADHVPRRLPGGRRLRRPRRRPGGRRRTVVAEVEASGLRGRGGAGFPTGPQVAHGGRPTAPTSSRRPSWSTPPRASRARSRTGRSSRANPYQVVEGALIAALVVGADRVVFGVKPSSGAPVERLRAAIDEIERVRAATAACGSRSFEGPAEYLYGEETALLEVIEGRPPLPRIAPPYRRGVDELGTSPDAQRPVRPTSTWRGPATRPTPPRARRQRRDPRERPGASSPRAPVVPQSAPTSRPARSCARSRRRRHAPASARSHGHAAPRGHRRDRRRRPRRPHASSRSLPGVSDRARCPRRLLDTPLTTRRWPRPGAASAGGFIVFDDQDDLVAAVGRRVAVPRGRVVRPVHAVQAGRPGIADLLGRLARSDAHRRRRRDPGPASRTVADGARCYLGHQQQAVVRSLLETFPEAVVAHFDGRAEPAEPRLVAELVELRDGSRRDRRAAPRTSSRTGPTTPRTPGSRPADRLDEKRAHDCSVRRRACTRWPTACSPTSSPTAPGGGATPGSSPGTAGRCSSTRCSICGSPAGCSTRWRRCSPAGRSPTLVNTHANGDHCYGNQLVAGAGVEIVASARAAAEMEDVTPATLHAMVTADLGPELERLRAAHLRPFEFDGIEVAPPTRTFEGRARARRGRPAGPAHRGGPGAHRPATWSCVGPGRGVVRRRHPLHRRDADRVGRAGGRTGSPPSSGSSRSTPR